jgi:hypothetical protein
VVIGLAILILVPTIVYYELSYNPVNGTHPELVIGYPSVGFCSATYHVTVHVLSWAGSLNTEVTTPDFYKHVVNRFIVFSSRMGIDKVGFSTDFFRIIPVYRSFSYRS